MYSYGSSSAHKNAGVLLIGPADSLDYMPSLFSRIVTLLAGSTLLSVSICIHWQQFCPYIVL
jgi:hypothetical protein